MKKQKITKATDNAVTENFLDGRLKTEFALFGVEVDEKLEKLDEKNKGYKDQILTGLDGVMKELQDMREENAASTLHFERTDEKLSDHEARIKTLEHSKN
jgi:hypothetical protein